MKTTVEQENPTRIKLQVEVDADEVKPLSEETYKRLSKDVTVPGFRKGKAPRSLVESRLGADTLREEVLKDVIPAFYVQALKEQKSVRPIANPDVEVTQFEDGKPLTFTAVVDVLPEIKLPKYKGLETERPDVEPTEEEVAEQLERLRYRFGTLEPVTRPAAENDYVNINITGYQHDKQIEAASAEDLLYEMGSGLIVPQLDSELLGKRTGEMFKFSATLPDDGRFGEYGGQEVGFRGIVKEVHRKELPELDDEFAKSASEYDTLDALREEVSESVKRSKQLASEIQIREKLVEDIIDRSDFPIPEALVTDETQHRLARLIRDLGQAGQTLEKYLEAVNATQEQLISEHRQVAEKVVAGNMILESIAEQEGLTVEPEEVQEEVDRLAEASQKSSEELAKELQESNAIQVLAGDILRRKTLDFLVEHAEIIEKESGNE